jgi:hypothetical protein
MSGYRQQHNLISIRRRFGGQEVVGMRTYLSNNPVLSAAHQLSRTLANFEPMFYFSRSEMYGGGKMLNEW